MYLGIYYKMICISRIINKTRPKSVVYCAEKFYTIIILGPSQMNVGPQCPKRRNGTNTAIRYMDIIFNLILYIHTYMNIM